MATFTAVTALPTTATPAETRLGLVGAFATLAADLAADPADVLDAVPDSDLDLIGDLAELVSDLVEALAWRNQAANPDAPPAPVGVATGSHLERLLYAARTAGFMARLADTDAQGLAEAV